ncbi:MAG TPA: methylated-DNA--[protein]-cysteine S-methyltransferase [Euzebyales bacterium]|nr:methylated-DNA--[protein]-cysteine S-methyltransferase [Euzebyales bacterium]
MAYVTTTTTPAGPFTVIADDDDTVLASGWTPDRDRLLRYIAADLRPARLADRDGGGPVAAAVTAYHDGDLAAPDAVAVRHSSGVFMTAAWGALRKVAPGEVISYRELAHRAGSPGAIRAAGSACARNPTALFIPCHRVRRGDGTLGGFGYGLDIKRWLLDHEGAPGHTGTLPL